MKENNIKNGIEDVKALFSSLVPTKLFTNIKERPTILVPLVVMLLILFIYVVLGSKVYSDSAEYISQQLFEQTGSQSAADFMYETQVEAESVASNIIVTFMGSSVGIIIFTALGSAFTLLLVKLFGGDATFKQMFSLNAYISIVSYLWMVLATAIMILLKTNNDIFSVATVFMPNGNMFDSLYVALDSLRLYFIHTIFLNILGLKIISEFESYAKPTLICLINTIIPIIFSVGIIYFMNYVYTLM